MKKLDLGYMELIAGETKAYDYAQNCYYNRGAVQCCCPGSWANILSVQDDMSIPTKEWAEAELDRIAETMKEKLNGR